MQVEKKCTSSTTSEGEPYLTADKKQISVPFTTSKLVKTIEINFSGPEPAQIAELFIHTKKSVPGKKTLFKKCRNLNQTVMMLF